MNGELEMIGMHHGESGRAWAACLLSPCGGPPPRHTHLNPKAVWRHISNESSEYLTLVHIYGCRCIKAGIDCILQTRLSS